MRAALIALPLMVLALQGCTPPTQLAPKVGIDLIPDSQGLGIEGSRQRIDFGRSPKGVFPTLTRELGAGKPVSLAGCPAGILQQVEWGDITLTFTNERFVGWKTATARAGQTCA